MTMGVKSAYPYKLARLMDHDDDLTKRWWVDYYAWSEAKEKLVRKRVEVTGPTLKLRQEKAAAIIREVNQKLKKGFIVSEGPVDEPVPIAKVESATNIEAAIALYLSVKGNTLKKNSSKTYKSALNRFKTYLKENNLLRLKIEKFTPAQAFAYIDGLTVELANKSVNNHLGAVESLFNFYLDRQQIKANPFIAVKRLPERPGKHMAFRPEQIARIKEACELTQDHQLWLFLNFMYFTLARPNSELRLLKVSDIGEKAIRIDGENAKANGTGFVLIAPGLEQLLQKHKIREYPAHYYVFGSDGAPSEKVVYEKYFYNQHRRILTLLKMTDLSYDLYGWKHTGVIALYRATKDVKLIQRQCRHKNLDQTDKYLRDLGLFLDENPLNGLAAL
jgi:integrase